MAKTCEINNCSYPVFSRKQCLSHWKLHYGKSLKKRSEKGKVKAEVKKELLKLDEKFYLEIWAEREHYCFFCGDWLGHDASNWNFHHVILKSKAPELRHDKSNIVLVCMSCHSKQHN